MEQRLTAEDIVRIRGAIDKGLSTMSLDDLGMLIVKNGLYAEAAKADRIWEADRARKMEGDCRGTAPTLSYFSGTYRADKAVACQRQDI